MRKHAITLDSSCSPVYRTKLMIAERAEQFAVCLRRNSRFVAVYVKTSNRARSLRDSFVTFRPANVDCVIAMADRMQCKRTAKALTEGAGYIYVADLDHERPFYWCLSTSGETYEVDHGSCSCPDFQYNCKRGYGYGVVCKHIERLRLAVAVGDLLSTSDLRRTPEWAERQGFQKPATFVEPAAVTVQVDNSVMTISVLTIPAEPLAA